MSGRKKAPQNGNAKTHEQVRLREMLAELETILDGLLEKQGVPKQEYETDRDLQDIVEGRSKRPHRRVSISASDSVDSKAAT